MTGPGVSRRFAAAARAASAAGPGGRKRVEQPIDHPLVWRAGESQASWRTRPTGFEALDRLLPGGGWPATGLTEILTGHCGIGELSLLMPALARLAGPGAARGRRRGSPGQGGGAGCIAWIAPPFIPYAPALRSRGIDLDRVLIVRGRGNTRGHRDILWAMEQALRFGSCAAVLAWTRSVGQTPLRRLQLAAEAGRCWAVLFRPLNASRQRSSAVLRMRLSAMGGQTRIEVLKCRGGRPGTVSIRFEDPIFSPGGVGARLCGAPAPRPLAGQENKRGRAISGTGATLSG